MSNTEYRSGSWKPGIAPDASAEAGWTAVQGAHVLDYLRVLYKRRGTAAGLFLTVIAAVAAFTYTQVRVYEAQGQLIIEPERPRVVVFKEDSAVESDRIDYQETQHRILQSRSLALRTITALDLSKHPELVGPPIDQMSRLERLLASAGAAAARVVTRFSKPAPRPDFQEEHGRNESLEIAGAIDAFLGRLTIAPVRNSQLVEVKFRAVDPELAARVTNALMKNYIGQNLELRAKAGKEANDVLTRQLEDQREKMRLSQAALQEYRERFQTADSERQSVSQQKLAELTTALGKVRTERLQKEVAYQQVVKAGHNVKALAELPAIRSADSLQALRSALAEQRRQEAQLRETLGARHPDLRNARRNLESLEAKIEAEVLKLADSVRNEYATAADHERSFTQAVDEQRHNALLNRRSDIEYDRLLREAQTDQEVFQSLLQRTKETAVATDLLSNNIRLVDAADVPRRPVSPQPYRNMLLGLFAGLTLAIAGAFGADYLDKTAKTPEDVKFHLGLPCLGLVPMVGKHETNPRRSWLASRQDPLLNNGTPPGFKEAFRVIRTNLLFAASGESARTVLITSTRPREGKTVVAANLAMALALTGRKVLLVDADLRRPKIHGIFDHPAEPGLSSLLEHDDDDFSRSIHSCGQGLWLLPAGPVPSNPAEILSSQRFQQILARAEQQFDWVIIDSAPVMAVTDAAVVANVAAAVVFVVGAELTSVPAAQNALSQLDAARAKFAGAVLNRVKLQRNAYYYAHHYRREYEAYYAPKHA